MHDHERRDSHFKLAPDGQARWRALVNEMLLREDAFLFVSEAQNRVVGYCLGWLAQNPPVYAIDTVGFVSELAVTSKLRGQGVGSALFAAARGWFNANEIHQFQLSTAIWNEEAQRFWQRQGGRPILTRFRFDV